MATHRDPPRTKVEAAAPAGSAPTRANPLPKRAAPTKAGSRSGSRPVPGVPGNAVEARVEVSNEGRYRMIAEAAYLRAERRGFVPGSEVEDWLAAEAEVERLLAAEHVPMSQ